MDAQKAVYEISTHALREEGDIGQDEVVRVPVISTHALREEGDAVCRRGTHAQPISTHALREEGDLIILPVKDYEFIDFYPRPPRGGRPPNPTALQ